ncbi:MAG: 1,4-alpha-glucan branching protein GlgB [Brevinema sp.]
MLINNLWKKIKRDSFGVFGLQEEQGRYTVKILNHQVDQLILCDKNSSKEYPLSRDKDGFFNWEGKQSLDYLIKNCKDDREWVEQDPYLFLPVISEFDLYLFSEGTHRRVWEVLGSHIVEHQGVSGTVFAVWAPHAVSVRLIGEFNNWDQNRFYMRLRGATGIWEFFIPDLTDSAMYKFAVESFDGSIVEKSDPYAVYAELRPHTASISYSLGDYDWQDKEWMKDRSRCIEHPLSIYECHLDSWIRDDENKAFSYRDLAAPLAEYILDHGFTHIELMPITEYPYDGSWGYQVTGYYAVTSRYGTPHDFMYFVDYMHQQGIGIILDWVPAHFPSDSHGLANFDGTSLYEHEDERLGWHHDWGTYIFNYGRNEVRQFLVGSALFWMDMYHIDGLRVDAVASMLYLDYSRKEGEWIPNRYGGRENLEAIEFLQSLHAEIDRYYPQVMTIAEESTSYLGVTAPTIMGGLGFTYKWNMGWMNDTLRYFSVDPLFRPWHHSEITFSLIYAFSERFILPFSHDEVVHGKGSLLDRMPGSTWEKFANLRLMYAYMWGHPGKKLLFAGQEWAPWQEWSESRSIDWHLNQYHLHAGMRQVIKDLNHVYQEETALYQLDTNPYTFTWLDCDNKDSGLLMWIRQDSQNNQVLIVLNLNTVVKINYRIGVPSQGAYREILNTDRSIYGGANILNEEYIHTDYMAWQGQEHSLVVNVGPLAAVIFKIYPH